ncbi:hypothetical protein KM043_007699 [Ampulex compressa]|nr:hypothetical protein KM043_007699 [Ampulex compressa]
MKRTDCGANSVEKVKTDMSGYAKLSHDPNAQSHYSAARKEIKEGNKSDSLGKTVAHELSGVSSKHVRPAEDTSSAVMELASFGNVPIPLVLSVRDFGVPSEPHAHGRAPLKIWNQCDQNGCYGRAPVYRTVSVRPGAGPSFADPGRALPPPPPPRSGLEARGPPKKGPRAQPRVSALASRPVVVLVVVIVVVVVVARRPRSRPPK